jgi:hypothetical protein
LPSPFIEFLNRIRVLMLAVSYKVFYITAI